MWKWRRTPPPHEHAFYTLWSDDHAEIDENDAVRHTAFMLMACECRHVEPFPKQNFNLCTPRYRAALRKQLAELNWNLEKESV